MGAEWGTGRREVSAQLDFIQSALRDGRSIRSIHRELNSSGKVTIKLRTFSLLVSPIRDALDADSNVVPIRPTGNAVLSAVPSPARKADDPHTSSLSKDLPSASPAAAFEIDHNFSLEE